MLRAYFTLPAPFGIGVVDLQGRDAGQRQRDGSLDQAAP
jgi:hypothetical protein